MPQHIRPRYRKAAAEHLAFGDVVHGAERLANAMRELLDPQENRPIGVPLTIHPGVRRSLGGSWTAGLRMAFDVGGASWGFTPLLNKGFPIGDQTYFVELVVPIRFQDDSFGDTHNAIGFGVHVGIGF